MAQFNIVGPKFSPEVDMKLFFTDEQIETGKLDVELTFIEEADKTMAHLLTRLKKFGSVGEAKRNGWDKPIPDGWTELSIGKGAKRWDFFIWNPTTTMDEFNELDKD